MTGGRFQPGSAPLARVIDRDRLVRLLAGRFDHRVTLVVGAAGYGKTTALSLAVEQNRAAPTGDDVWLSVVPADRNEQHLLSGLASAVGAAGGSDGLDPAAIADAVWSRAPRPVAIVLDDAHVLDGSPSISVLRELLDLLPANGSLVIASRTPVDIPVGRLRAHGRVLEITAEQLAFTDDELRRLSTERGSERAADLAALPRHAASADLQLVAGVRAGSEFVWEEILSNLGDDRLHQLQRLAVLDQLDDFLIDRMTDGAFEASSIFGDLPLIETGDDSYRMHDILREALTARLPAGERSKALSIAGDAERERHRLAQAVGLYDAANDPISAIECARQLVLGPLLSMSSLASAEVRRTVARLRPDSHLNAVFEAFRNYVGAEKQAAAALRSAAETARAAGDDEVEAVCRHRCAQVLLLQHDHGYGEEVRRIAEIGQRNELAAAITRYYGSVEAQIAGDGTTARESLDDLDALDALGPMHAVQVRAERLSDLGHPELVIAGLDEVDHRAMPDAVAQWVGMAMLQCAIAPIEHVLPLTLKTAAAAERRGFSHPASFTLSVAALIALACGELATAEREVERARAHADTGVGPTAEAVVRYAEAALIADTGDEQAAADVLHGLGGSATKWPGRAELWMLPIAYLLRPERRAVIDAAAIGPALSAARTAAQALVALREHGDATLSRVLAWDRLDLLRIHVTPIHLVELACAAAPDIPAAEAALEIIPRADLLLGRLAAGDGPVAELARERVERVPTAEPFALCIDLLGPVRVVRSDTADTADGDVTDLARRPKAAELLGLLTERRRVDRFETIAQIWPEHDDERKALGSLRTTLGTLNDALEPDRARGATAFHLRTDGDLLELDRRVSTDVERFESIIDGARADDENGLPARALDGYRSALELYRGDFLHGIDAGWAELPRVRLRSLATGAMCRVGELVAARGEPEEAARWADRALGHDHLDERAIRCLVAALDASGDRSGARRCAETSLRRLTEAGITPTPETTRLVDRLR